MDDNHLTVRVVVKHDRLTFYFLFVDVDVDNNKQAVYATIPTNIAYLA